MAVYVIGEGNNFYEGMTKEQILAAIVQAIETHTISDVDTGFVTKIKEQNKNTPIALWAGTEAEYNALETKDHNTLYIKTDDSTVESLMEQYDEFSEAIEKLSVDYIVKRGTITMGSYTWTYAVHNTGNIELWVTVENYSFNQQGSSGDIKYGWNELPLPISELYSLGYNVDFINSTFLKESSLSSPADTESSALGYWTGALWYTADDYIRISVYTMESSPALTDGIIHLHIILKGN